MAKEKKTRSLRIMNMHIPYHILMVIWSFISIFPLWFLVINTFKVKKEIYLNFFGLPQKWTLENYESLLGSRDFFVYYFFVIGMMLPIKIATIRLLQIMKALNTLNTLFCLFPVYIAMGLPTAVFILTEFIHGLPRELYEAGYMDGASRFRIWYRIVLPLTRPALATVAIYNLVPIWNDLWFPLIFITKESSKTVLLAVTRLQGQYTTDWPKLLTVLTLSSLPVIALYLAMSQSFIKGLTAGAVKG